jgi:ribosomal protein S18 acetylase RimI-like enzyme
MIDESVDMLLQIPKDGFKPKNPPANFELARVHEVDTEDLYHVYYRAFEAEHAGFFLSQDEYEKRAYFDELSEMNIDTNASMALLNGSQAVGFTYLIKYGNPEYMLTCICIDPEYWSRGLGRVLLESSVNTIYQLGGTEIGLFTDVCMRAFQLYTSLGWKVTKRYPRNDEGYQS